METSHPGQQVMSNNLIVAKILKSIEIDSTQLFQFSEINKIWSNECELLISKRSYLKINESRIVTYLTWKANEWKVHKNVLLDLTNLPNTTEKCTEEFFEKIKQVKDDIYALKIGIKFTKSFTPGNSSNFISLLMGSIKHLWIFSNSPLEIEDIYSWPDGQPDHLLNCLLQCFPKQMKFHSLKKLQISNFPYATKASNKYSDILREILNLVVYSVGPSLNNLELLSTSKNGAVTKILNEFAPFEGQIEHLSLGGEYFVHGWEEESNNFLEKKCSNLKSLKLKLNPLILEKDEALEESFKIVAKRAPKEIRLFLFAMYQFKEKMDFEIEAEFKEDKQNYEWHNFQGNILESKGDMKFYIPTFKFGWKSQQVESACSKMGILKSFCKGNYFSFCHQFHIFTIKAFEKETNREEQVVGCLHFYDVVNKGVKNRGVANLPVFKQ